MNILGYEYRLRLDKDRNDLEAWGQMNSRTMEIQIASNLVSQQVMSTLLHEIVECLKFHLSIKIEHEDLNRLETGIYQVLVENGVDLSPLLREIILK